MPELPEVETTLRGLKPHIKGQKIVDVDIRNPRLRWRIADDFATHLTSSTVESLERRAKFIIIYLGQGYWVIHLGMSGSLSFHDSSAAYLKHDHVIIHFQQGYQLRYNDPRRFGSMVFVKDLSTLPSWQKLGPEPLSDEFDPMYLIKRCKKTSKPIKSMIMDQHVVVGVGNIYATEALFLSNIHPARSANTITHQECIQLVKNIQQCLHQAINMGGTTLKDFVNPDSRSGYFQQTLQVYGREGKSCYVCGSMIHSVRLNQRSSPFCENCQPIND
ncbi:MAG TPA: bifunctional DNA-formamidopyrimidine glycosylase/DNA-(apurinic or apyrimidinic site) lyase [Gammaproteobacteria bacterium]|nr:bifunctional DNA-formamidopyrimidine glycosylase/DNA-(apurinic or apyrimidinic site) lyase [Gammaproteobacteria bacterium]